MAAILFFCPGIRHCVGTLIFSYRISGVPCSESNGLWPRFHVYLGFFDGDRQVHGGRNSQDIVTIIHETFPPAPPRPLQPHHLGTNATHSPQPGLDRLALTPGHKSCAQVRLEEEEGVATTNGNVLHAIFFDGIFLCCYPFPSTAHLLKLVNSCKVSRVLCQRTLH